MGIAYSALGDYDQAYNWFEIALTDQEPDPVILGELKYNPYSDPVLDEPRFQELRDRIGR